MKIPPAEFAEGILMNVMNIKTLPSTENKNLLPGYERGGPVQEPPLSLMAGAYFR